MPGWAVLQNTRDDYAFFGFDVEGFQQLGVELLRLHAYPAACDLTVFDDALQNLPGRRYRNGKAVGNVTELLGAVAALKPGVAAPLSVQRAGKTTDSSVTPAKRQRPKVQN